MNNTLRATGAFAIMAALLVLVGFQQSWSVSLSLLNLCLISAVMALGVNIQWGYAGLLNLGVMGFAALGGAAALLVSQPIVMGAWVAGGSNIAITAVLFIAYIALMVFLSRRLRRHKSRTLILIVVGFIGFLIVRHFYEPAVLAVEGFESSKTGYLGGLGLPIIFSWVVGGVFAAGAAWLIGKVALGLRADYLAIATLGISEIVVAMLKNEDWLTRGVKNVSGLKRPVPYELDLQQTDWFIKWVEQFRAESLMRLGESEYAAALQKFVIEGSSVFVKLCYAGLFTSVLVIILCLCVLALDSPWGRMVRAIRDNEEAAEAMGKNVTGRHLQIFILGSAVVGIAGAMLTTLDGQFTPGTYNPLRFTFLIWVMVIVGGSGNNLGAVIGGFLIWFVWIEAEPVGIWLIDKGTAWMGDDSPIREHLMDSAQYMRVMVMGGVLLLVMRFSPGGILPEQINRK